MNKKFISIILLILTLLITLSLGSYNFIKDIKSNKEATIPIFMDNNIQTTIPIKISNTTPPILKK
jgi:hypothetical protein